MTVSGRSHPRCQAVGRAFLATVTVGIAVSISCSGVDDPPPCGETADSLPCPCDPDSGMSSLPTISVPDQGFDGVVVRMIGPDTVTVSLTLEGNQWVAAPRPLVPGVYTLVVEGYVMGETAYFGSVEGITAVACEPVEPTSVPFSSFRPGSLGLTAAAPAIAATWDAVAQAQYYLIERDSTSAFLTPLIDSVPDTTHVMAAARTGWHYVRVRAAHALVFRGRASEPDSVNVGADGASVGGALPRVGTLSERR